MLGFTSNTFGWSVARSLIRKIPFIHCKIKGYKTTIYQLDKTAGPQMNRQDWNQRIPSPPSLLLFAKKDCPKRPTVSFSFLHAGADPLEPTLLSFPLSFTNRWPTREVSNSNLPFQNWLCFLFFFVPPKLLTSSFFSMLISFLSQDSRMANPLFALLYVFWAKQI